LLWETRKLSLAAVSEQPSALWVSASHRASGSDDRGSV
jgi:hypothetical protein